MRPWRIVLTFALLALLLAGCGSPKPSPGPEAAPLPALPSPLHAAQSVPEGVELGPFSCIGAHPGPCFDYPIYLPRPALIDATLTWQRPTSNMAMLVFKGATQTSAIYNDGITQQRTTFSISYPAYGAGNYTVRVSAQEGFVLDVTFSELTSDAWRLPGPAPVYGPHVVIGIPDSGINPYHELFYRPELTEPPCTYIRGMPCDLRELRLHVGMADFDKAVELDRTAWDGLEPGAWYWIPQTVFVAVRCNAEEIDDLTGQASPRVGTCILDDNAAHGSATTSIAISQNPEAYIAFNEGTSAIQSFRDGGLPIDIYSVSFGGDAPFAVPSAAMDCPLGDSAPLYVTTAGNRANVPWADCWKGNPEVIVVGGGYTAPYAHDALSGNFADVESYFCPPIAPNNQVFGMRSPGSDCGTSYSTPTVAGALSKVILEVRRASGYEGSLSPEGLVDPILGVSVGDLRDAMNLTATYTPPAKHRSLAATGVPLNQQAPWQQWGWGFYDGDIANATIAHLLQVQTAPDKPTAAVQYMAGIYEVRKTLHG